MGFLSECTDVHSLAFLNHPIIVVTLWGILPIHLQSVPKFVLGTIRILKLRRSNNRDYCHHFWFSMWTSSFGVIIWRYQWYMRHNTSTWLDWFFSGFYTSDELMQKIWLKKPLACSDLLNCFTSIDLKPCNRIIKRAENQKWIMALS